MKPSELSEVAVRRVFRNLLWFLILINALCYIDRLNIGFAALTMNTELGISATIFGLSGTIFYILYGLAETPSVLMMARFGARRWIPRIMVTWGLASCVTIFATGPYSLIFLRSLVGLAEAGLLPGILFYLGQWVPQTHRARANAILLCAQPGALMIAGPISGFILQMDGTLSMAGWRWLLLLEGLPSVLVGIWAYFRLVDDPKDAKFLNSDEKAALVARIDEEHVAQDNPHGGKVTVWRDVLTRKVVLLALGYFCIIANLNTLGIWMPLIVREVLGGTEDTLRIGLITTIPPLITILAMPMVSAYSDRRADRRMQFLAGCLFLAIAGCITVALSPIAVFRIAGLTLSMAGTYCAQAVFWAMTLRWMSRQMQPAAIGIISTAGAAASVVSPSIIGTLRDLTQSFSAGLWYAAVLLALGVLLIRLVARMESRQLKAE